MENKIKETTAWINIHDLERVCKSVENRVTAEIAGTFAQRRTLEKAMAYAGALSDPRIPVKTSWQIFESLGHENPGRVQSLMGENKWDFQEVWDGIATLAAGIEGGAGGDPLGIGVIVDETAQEKRGKSTAGVGYQYAGIAGRTINCTTWVSAALVGPRYKTWVSSALYLQEKLWFTGVKETGTARRRKAGIPKGTRFRTKPQIARKQFQHLRDTGIGFQWAGGDEVYGRYLKLREDHERNGEAYAYFVPRDHVVASLGGELRKVSELLELKGARFEERSAGPGLNGPRYYGWAMIGIQSPNHYVLVRQPIEDATAESETGRPAGPLGKDSAGPREKSQKKTGRKQEKSAGEKDKLTYCLCYVPPGSAIKPTISNLALMAGRRWGIEEANSDEKGPAGWDENQFRNWDSLHRHTALAGLAVLMAHMVIQGMEEAAETPGAVPGGNEKEGGERKIARTPPPAERKFNPRDLMIPVGDSLVPASPGQAIPREIGFIRLSVNEVTRLIAIAKSDLGDAGKTFHLRCSQWRRKHQAVARWYHQITRLKNNTKKDSPPAGKAQY